jgi:hypothetical protein
MSYAPRPLTDPAIGGSRASQMRRKLDAEASAAFSTPTLLDALTERRRNKLPGTQTPGNAQKGTQAK